MVRKIRFLALVLLPLCLFGCSMWAHKGANSPGDLPAKAVAPSAPLKVRVVGVTNDTRNLYDVDVIGMLWNGLEKSLKQRGMLWTPKSAGTPYLMTGHITYFKNPILLERIYPYMGDTVLKVSVDISRDGKHVATIEDSRSIGYGKGMWTLHAWKEVFAQVSQAVVKQAAQRLYGVDSGIAKK